MMNREDPEQGVVIFMFVIAFIIVFAFFLHIHSTNRNLRANQVRTDLEQYECIILKNPDDLSNLKNAPRVVFYRSQITKIPNNGKLVSYDGHDYLIEGKVAKHWMYCTKCYHDPGSSGFSRTFRTTCLHMGW